ncbi:thymidine kinase [Paenibacillus catalpae]|uniref:Thymidine kinase n=1 Tax=Paenibacillus catalpae TaxID=1045775 RepID=A0A1I1TB30_9BACL|nr:thymidine kinase [Paenibacillus catalpae]SFD55857.1 thymidine kinase [Paenibacillus catalpae]
MERGFITVIIGPMFSEKSGELIRRCQKLMQYGRKQVRAYKPAEDDRFSTEEIVSRIGYRLPAVSVPRELSPSSVEQILRETRDADVVAFDEASFFGKPIIALVEELAYQGKHIIVDGLNMDYRGKEFGYIGGLLAIADEIVKLTSFCAVCGDANATFTQRIVNGKPASLGPVFLIGDTESYEPRCRSCFVPPHKVTEEDTEELTDTIAAPQA